MASLNKVMLIGRLGQEPEKRITQGGHSVMSISLATTERFKDQSGTQQERTEWHRLVFWNRLAEIIEDYCKKGSQIYVEGTLQTNEWTDKDGNKRYTTEIVARNMQLLDSKGQSNQGGSTNSGGGSQPAYSQPNNNSFQEPTGFENPPKKEDDFVEDDIPF